MKDRLATVLGGLLAFGLVVMLLVPVERGEGERISRPLSTDRGPHGLRGLQRWLEEGGIRTEALRERYSALARGALPNPRGNLLVVSLPGRLVSREDERAALRDWLALGNSALLLVAAGDVPRWRFDTQSDDTRRFLSDLGFELAAGAEIGEADDEDEEEEGAGGSAVTAEGLSAKDVWLMPLFTHPLTHGVASVSARSVPVLDRGWTLRDADGDRALLPLLEEDAHGTAAFWEIRVGRGRAWVSRYAGLFANARLGDGDNARLAANLVAAALGRGGRVIFDDMHHGATDLYDPQAFFRDPRFLHSLAFLAGFWLLYLVGSSRRLAPPRENPPRYLAADLATAMSGFLARRVDEPTAARELFRHFFNDVRSRYGLPTNGEPAWSLLESMARVSESDVGALRRQFRRAAAGARTDLVALARVMQRTRESLL